MCRSRRFLTAITALAICALCSVVTGQGKTWVVNAKGGGDFKDLPAALAAARNGDTIRVRPGSYSGGKTSKALTILGDVGAKIRSNSRYPTLEIVNLPKDQTFVLKGITAEFSPFPPRQPDLFLRIVACLGRVHVDRLFVDLTVGSLVSQASGIPVLINNSRHVTLQHSTLSGTSGLVVYTSKVVVNNCSLKGDDALLSFFSSRFAWPGIVCSNAELVVSECQVQGGRGAMFCVVNCNTFPPAPGMSMSLSRVTVAGSKNSRIAAGTFRTLKVSAIEGSGGSLLRDPRVKLVSGGAAPLVAPSIPSRILRMPAMTTTGAGPGGTFKIDLLSMGGGDLAEIYLSLPAYPWSLPIPNIGEAWIDVFSLIVLGRFQVPSNEHVCFSLPIPNLASLRGLPIVVQALVANKTQIRFSTPATVVLD